MFIVNMNNILGKRILVHFQNDSMDWVELKRVCHEKCNTFKVKNENTWYSKDTIVDVPSLQTYNDNCCVNCKVPVMHKLLCKDTYCPNDFRLAFDSGFVSSSKNSELYRDHRITSFPQLRENLWSRTEPFEENTHMQYSNKLYSVKQNKFLPKSCFADRRLKWANRGKRYNLHAR
jgi:hypothetical protein